MASKKKTEEPAPVMLGFKRICPGCGTRYYDRGLVPPVCPSCNAEFNPDALLKNRRSRIIEDEKVAAVTDADDEELNDEDEALKVLGDDELDEEEEGEDALIEDTSELGEDDEDIIEIEDTDEEEDQ